MDRPHHLCSGHDDYPGPSRAQTQSTDTELTDITSSTRPSHSPSEWSLRAHESAKERDIRRQYQQVPDIATEMERWYSAADRYGFLDTDSDPANHNEKQVEREIERSEKWVRMACKLAPREGDGQEGDGVHKFYWSAKFVKRIYKGIPDCWRGDAWYYLCTDKMQNTRNDHDLRVMYKELVARPTPHEHQIDLDIPRTMHGHIMFRQRYGSGQRSLFKVLCAFANYDTEVGYCQGMTNIAAMILMYCEEEKAFRVLVHMFLRDKLHNLFIPGFPALMECFFVQNELVRRVMPKLSRHLHDIGLTSDVYATRWYITLFTGGVVKYHTLLRIWDIYFLCGFDVFFFVALALLKTFQSRLLAGDLEQCMELLGATMTVPDDNRFVKLVKKYHDRHQENNTLQVLRAEYQHANRTRSGPLFCSSHA